jgi:phosphoglycerol transferase MdoB-like AlkP superfamily enzyme
MIQVQHGPNVNNSMKSLFEQDFLILELLKLAVIGFLAFKKKKFPRPPRKLRGIRFVF